jgi:hypothetical protein
MNNATLLVVDLKEQNDVAEGILETSQISALYVATEVERRLTYTAKMIYIAQNERYPAMSATSRARIFEGPYHRRQESRHSATGEIGQISR